MYDLVNIIDLPYEIAIQVISRYDIMQFLYFKKRENMKKNLLIQFHELHITKIKFTLSTKSQLLMHIIITDLQ